MKFSNFGRKVAALVSTLALGAGLSSCGSGTIGYLYVLGTLTNSGTFGQISGFKIDDRTGNLTNMVNSPYTSGGVNPGNAVVFPGGRFLYVLNKGTSTAGTVNACPVNTGASVAEYLVGGDGVLTYQGSYYSQGVNPQWLSLDSSGRYLYVIDQVNPTCSTKPAGTSVTGDITVFGVATDTGRLTTIMNTGLGSNNPPPDFEVGYKPSMLRVVGSYVYTLDTGDESIFIYNASTAGQLVKAASYTTGTIGTNITSIGGNTSGSYIYLTDAGTNMLYIYTVGSSGALSSLTLGNTALPSVTSNPVWTMASQNGKFLYVVSQGNSTNPTVVQSAITAYSILSTGVLELVSDTSNPYPTGAGSVCMVQDPTNQYVYVSNHNDSTVTGYALNANTGQLSSLTRTTVFPISGQASCLVVSGYTS